MCIFGAMTFKEAFQLFDTELEDIYDKDERLNIFLLTTDMNRVSYYLQSSAVLPANKVTQLKKLLIPIKKGVPVQYVMGEADFFGRKFKVSPAVLIPRPETEELVDWVTQTILKSWPDGKIEVLDIGTGSGCIPIIIQQIIPNTKVSALDVSVAALNIAEHNAKSHHSPVEFFEADILSFKSHNIYTVIVSNPPYVRNSEKDGMRDNVINHEPHIALFVENEDPLVFYRAIAAFGLKNLTSNGYLFFEINEALGAEVSTLLSKHGYIDINIKKDLQGRERMIRCRRGF